MFHKSHHFAKKGNRWIEYCYVMFCYRHAVALAARPWARTALLRLPINVKLVYVLGCGLPHGMVMEMDETGQITRILEDRHGKVVKAVSEVEEHENQLWIGSVIVSQLAVHNL